MDLPYLGAPIVQRTLQLGRQDYLSANTVIVKNGTSVPILEHKSWQVSMEYIQMGTNGHFKHVI